MSPVATQKQFRALLPQELPKLYAVALRLTGDAEVAGDVVQEGVFTAFRKLDSFEGRSKLSTWLHRIVLNQALQVIRSRKRRAATSIDDLQPAFDETGHRTQPALPPPVAPEVLVQQAQVRKSVRDAIDQLPEAYRTVLLLRDIEELGSTEVASLLDISEGNVRIRLHRARAALKRLLEPIAEGVV